MKHTLSVSILTLFLTVATTAPCSPEDSARDHDITVEDYFSLANVIAVAVSPDGRTVAYTEQRWNPEADRRETDLWTVDTATRRVARLTFDEATERAPTWSHDGNFIYYQAGVSRPGETAPPYDGSTQVWRIPPGGGQPLAVTRVTDGIGSFRLSTDGTTLHFSIVSKHTDEEWKSLREEYPELRYGHGVTDFTEIQRLDLASWRTRTVFDEGRVVRTFDVSDDGLIAMVTTPDEELIHHEGWSRVEVFDPATSETTIVTQEGWRSEHPSPYGWLNEVWWSDDGRRLAFSISFDGFPTRVYTARRTASGYDLEELERPSGVSISGGSLSWRGASGDLCFLGDERARTRVFVARGSSDGATVTTSTLTPGDVAVEAFDFSSSGDNLVVVTSTLTDPDDIYRVKADGGLTRLTKVNPQVDTWKLPQISLVRWMSTDGVEVEGVLELPPGHGPQDGPLPLVVELHGGPTSDTKYRFRYWIYGRTLMAANGYALLSPNYRGSTGYGDDFMVQLVGHENDIDVKDIMAGVDAMIERGIADPDRLAVMGWSNGGFLTNCLITTNQRFKAASSGAGVIDQVMQWGVEDTPGHVINFMVGQQPWTDPDEYRAGSPLYRLGGVTTPTLIHVGENDPRVPVAHSKTLYRALRQYLEIPTELVIYPGEGHGLTTYTHRKAKMEWDLAWFRKYLVGDDPAAE